MKLGFSTASFFGKTLTEDSFDLIRSLEVEFCEVFLTTFSEYEESFIDLLLQRKGDLKVHSVHSLNTQFEPQLFGRADRTRIDAESFYRKMCCAGERLGAEFYTFHGLSRLKKNVTIDYPHLINRINGLTEIAQEYNMCLSYENVHWCLFSFPEFFLNLKPSCPKLCSTLDVKQARQSGFEFQEYIKTMGNSISTVHLCDVLGNKLCLPSQGDIKFTKLFEIIKSMPIDPTYIIEIYSGDYNSLDDLKRSRDYILECYERA